MGDNPTGASARSSEHALPPLGHERMLDVRPQLRPAIEELARTYRARPDFGPTSVVMPEEISEHEPFSKCIEAEAEREYRRYGNEDHAIQEANILGHHIYYLLNFELHRRKVFWVDASLSWMLCQTRLDIVGSALKLPFSSFCLVFNDPATLELADALLKADKNSPLRSRTPSLLSIYITQNPPTPEGITGIDISLLLELGRDKWPYLVSRSLCIRPEDHLEAILDSYFPDVGPRGRDPIFSSPPMRQLVHLVLNAILYATSVPEAWPVLESPIRRVQRSAVGRGAKKQRKTQTRVRELRGECSGENVFFLPGKIPISQLHSLQEMERSEGGRQLMARFMVRGHWRRANPAWQDQRVRWIEPYWKGPEMAAIIERQYLMKP